jgi:transcriptional regulator with XRE-family HTH domain
VTDDGELLASIGGLEGLAEMLRRVRADRGLSQDEIAAHVGRRRRFVEQIECARAPQNAHVLTVTLLARAGEVSVGLFVASFARPREDPLPWPREHQPPWHHAIIRPGATFGDTYRDLSAHGAIAGAGALGATLRELRVRQRDWPQRELAARTGINQRYLSSLERGAVPFPLLLTLARLGRAFGATTAAQIAYATKLAQSYAGEIEAPPLGRPFASWPRRSR